MSFACAVGRRTAEWEHDAHASVCVLRLLFPLADRRPLQVVTRELFHRGTRVIAGKLLQPVAEIERGLCRGGADGGGADRGNWIVAQSS